jgi:hypothetical protein
MVLSSVSGLMVAEIDGDGGSETEGCWTGHLEEGL